LFNYELKSEWLPGIKERFDAMTKMYTDAGFMNITEETYLKIREGPESQMKAACT